MWDSWWIWVIHADRKLLTVPFWDVAQLAEHSTVNRNVTGSTPVIPAECGWLVVRWWLISSLELRSIRKHSTKEQ